MLFTREEIEGQFPAELIVEAEQLLLAQPLQPDLMRNGELVTCLIPHGRQRFRTYIRSQRGSDGTLSIQGECSAHGTSACHHVVATLLAALAKSSTGGEGATRPVPASGASRSLLYLLHPPAEGAEGLQLQIVTARRLGDGHYESPRTYHASWAAQSAPPSFVTAEDQVLLKQCDAHAFNAMNERYQLRDYRGAQLLKALLQSGRCKLEQPDLPLSPGAPREVRLVWQVAENGDQSPQWESDAGLQVIDLQPQWYIDRSGGVCGPLESPCSLSCLQFLQQHPLVKPEQSGALRRELEQRFSGEGVALPRLLIVRKLPTRAPKPLLRLTGEGGDPAEGVRRNRVEVHFRYGSERLPAAQPGPIFRRFDGERVVEVQRNPSREFTWLEQLPMALLEPCGPPGLYRFPHADGIVQFQLHTLPALRKKGWAVDCEATFAHRLVEVSLWSGTVRRHQQGEWFDVSLGLQVEGSEINLLPLLLDFLHDLPTGRNAHPFEGYSDAQLILFELELGGRMVAIPFGRIRPLLEILIELYEKKPEDPAQPLVVGRTQMLRLADGGRELLEWEGAEEALDLVQRLREVRGIPAVDPPQGLRATLRPYQQAGLNWLQFLRAHRLCGLLADDMGLGKTLQTLAHLLLEHQQGRLDRPALVVAPTSLMGNWRREAQRFTPELRVLLLHGPHRKRHFPTIADHHLVLTTYTLLGRDLAQLKRQPWHLLILDEAQQIKNHKTQSSRAVRELDARHRLSLTGTPVENHPGELWSQFDFLMPGYLGSERTFRRLFRNPIEREGDSVAGHHLARRIRPFLLRRTKEEVAPELPEKSEMVYSVELEGAQRDLYETIRLSLHQKVKSEIADKGMGRSTVILLDALLKLRQVCCDPRLLKLEAARQVEGSAKLELLMELLPEMVEEGRSILLFSQFTSMLDLIEEEVRKVGIGYVRLTGATRDRDRPVEQFQSGEVPLFLISLKAGGVGLNLTAADTVIHYDPWWNPAAERQATDRAHRIGQQRPVFVYKLIGESTVEEKILAMQQRKQALAEQLLDQGGETAPRWSAEDVEMLFEPLPE